MWLTIDSEDFEHYLPFLILTIFISNHIISRHLNCCYLECLTIYKSPCDSRYSLASWCVFVDSSIIFIGSLAQYYLRCCRTLYMKCRLWDIGISVVIEVQKHRMSVSLSKLLHLYFFNHKIKLLILLYRIVVKIN